MIFPPNNAIDPSLQSIQRGQVAGKRVPGQGEPAGHLKHKGAGRLRYRKRWLAAARLSVYKARQDRKRLTNRKSRAGSTRLTFLL